MKLYLWRAVLSEYTDGVAFAIAETEAEARDQLRVTLEPEGAGWSPFADPTFPWPEPEVHEVTERFAFWRYGGG